MAGDERFWARRGRRVGAAALALVLALGLLLDGFAPGPADAGKRGRPRDADARIVGGTVVPAGKYPFMAFVEIDAGGGNVFSCGGSLLNATHVLTAAHCTEDPDTGVRFPPAAYALLFGQTSVRFGSACAACVRGVTNVAVHPGWDAATNANDAAVLTLDAPVDATLGQPVQLVAAGPGGEPAGRAVGVAGWGTRFTGAPTGSDLLLETTLAVTGDAACAAAWGPAFDPATMVCAAAPGRDSCQGDSGGPLFEPLAQPAAHAADADADRKHKRKRRPRPPVVPPPVPAVPVVQLGVVSFGAACADPRFPGVYARLSNPATNAFVRQAAGL